jgi:multisubunit Na+/H+ antiporter MnhC subunit
MSIKKVLTIFMLAFIGWMLCAALMGIGMSIFEEKVALIVHAAGAPVFFGLVSFIYFKRFNYTSPVATAIIFTIFVIAVDFFFVALLFLKSLDMFTSFTGTWLPFALIFCSTLLVGTLLRK